MIKKVSFFAKEFGIGGVERQLYYLVNGLSKSKYDISLVLCKKEGILLHKISEAVNIKDLGIRYSHIKKGIIGLKLGLLLLKNRPDIFISFHFHLNILSILICKILSIKVWICFPGYVPKGTLSLMRKCFYEKADKLISVSKGARDSLFNNIGMGDGGNNIVIDNCVDLKEIEEQSREMDDSLSEKRFIIVSAGRLSREKNFEVLIRAASLIPDDCLIAIIGDGENRENLERLTEQLGVVDRVKFFGYQINPYKFMKRARVYVLCASDSEGLPTVLLENMALGIPCVSPDYWGRTDDVIKHNVTGYIFPWNDYKRLASAINFVHDPNNSFQVKMIVENAQRNEVRYNIRRYVADYEKIIDETDTP